MKINFSLLLLCLLLSSCINDVGVTIKRKAQSVTSSPTPTPTPTPTPPLAALVWNYSSLVILPGEEVPFQLTNGVPPYVTDAQGVGTFDATTLIYTAPINQLAVNHTIDAEDAETKTGTNSFKISAFQKGSAISFPPTFGEQNYVTGATVTTNGNIFISSIVSDPNYERWVVFKSTDTGATWSEVDQYVPYEEGESHPLALASKNNDIYTCGYVWGDPFVYNSEWIVRKSTDAGSTWSIADAYHPNLGENHVCYDITVDQTTGHLFTSGYEDDVSGRHAIVRESADDGATWTTINNVNNDIFFNIKVSPNGTLWALAESGTLYKGTYSLGVWNWTTAGNLFSGAETSGGFYELRGRLLIIDDNTAFYSYSKMGWQINKTTDGGNTWTSSYTDVNTTSGRDILVASNGDLVAVGRNNVATSFFKIIKSSDNGTSWTTEYNNNTPAKHGQVLVEANDNSIIAFGNFDNSPYQILSVRSTDNGDNWTARPNVYFKQSLYTELNDFQVDANGTMWSTAWLNLIDDDYVSPWGVIKSSDDGATWTNSDVFTTVGDSRTADSITFGASNEIFVSGFNDTNQLILRKSTDNGATWTQIDSHIPAGSSWVYRTRTAVLPNGDVFYTAIAFIGPSTFSEIRRGTSNGTVWSSPISFPIQAGSTNFNLTGMKAFSDGSLWVYGTEFNSSAQKQGVIYRSTDSGATFVEKYRENVVDPFSESVFNLERASNGDIYVSSNQNIIKSTDNGTTWSNYYLGSTLGHAEQFTLDSNDKIYIINNDDQIITQNQFNNSFYVTYDFKLDNNYYDRELLDIKRCGNLAPVCAIGTYVKSIVGNYHMLIPLIIP